PAALLEARSRLPAGAPALRGRVRGWRAAPAPAPARARRGGLAPRQSAVRVRLRRPAVRPPAGRGTAQPAGPLLPVLRLRPGGALPGRVPRPTPGRVRDRTGDRPRPQLPGARLLVPLLQLGPRVDRTGGEERPHDGPR